MQQAQANLQKDEAQLTNAKAQYERNKVLYEQGVIAKQDLDTMQASFGTFEGTIASDKAAIENAKLNLTYCYIKSPIDGRIGLRQVDPGNYVTAAGEYADGGHHPASSHRRSLYLAGRPTADGAASTCGKARWKLTPIAATTRPSWLRESC